MKGEGRECMIKWSRELMADKWRESKIMIDNRR
jgi:hypothetical protein